MASGKDGSRYSNSMSRDLSLSISWLSFPQSWHGLKAASPKVVIGWQVQAHNPPLLVEQQSLLRRSLTRILGLHLIWLACVTASFWTTTCDERDGVPTWPDQMPAQEGQLEGAPATPTPHRQRVGLQNKTKVLLVFYQWKGGPWCCIGITNLGSYAAFCVEQLHSLLVGILAYVYRIRSWNFPQ